MPSNDGMYFLLEPSCDSGTSPQLGYRCLTTLECRGPELGHPDVCTCLAVPESMMQESSDAPLALFLVGAREAKVHKYW